MAGNVGNVRDRDWGGGAGGGGGGGGRMCVSEVSVRKCEVLNEASERSDVVRFIFDLLTRPQVPLTEAPLGVSSENSTPRES